MYFNVALVWPVQVFLDFLFDWNISIDAI